MKRSIAIAVIIFAISVFSGSQSWVQGNEIYGCYHKDSGQLRIVNKSGACRPSEIPISWNQIGQQSPTGSNSAAAQANAEPGPRVYDANGQFLGILPNDLYGAISIYIPMLSKFISLSSDNGDVDPFFPAVYLYFGLENRIADNEDELKSLRYNQNTYIFPDIRVLENEVIDFKLERERIRKDIARLNEIIHD